MFHFQHKNSKYTLQNHIFIAFVFLEVFHALWFCRNVVMKIVLIWLALESKYSTEDLSFETLAMHTHSFFFF